MADEAVLGVDIGGSKVAAGLVNAAGEIGASTRLPMDAGSAAAALACVRRAIDHMLAAGAPVSAIGLAAPGPLDVRSGVIGRAPNLACWHDFPLRDEIARAYGLPTRLENDANAAGLAEAIWGSGTPYRCVFYVTIGTGIGTALILDRTIHHGRTGGAAEGGHVSIDYRGEVFCGCGKPGCVEGLVAGPAITRAAQRRVAAETARAAKLLSMAGGRPQAVTARLVIDAWQSGDALATEILQERLELLAVWLGNMVDLLEPDVIIVGGGVGSQLEKWFDWLRQRMARWSINSHAAEIPLLLPRYGVLAGVAGSAALWLHEPHFPQPARG